MKKMATILSAAAVIASCGVERDESEVTIITLDPGHFHAALVQKTQYPQVSKDVYVYSPGGADLQEHLSKIEGYNTRAEIPTAWNEIVYEGDDFLAKMLSEKKGNVMVTAGNNSRKIDYIKKTLEAGINVLADKPMAINTSNFQTLRECFDIAEKNGVLLYDIMTERFEISTILQRELSQIAAIYGTQLQGTPQEPAITKESVHHFYKEVSGKPLTRPAWFYDVTQQGEGIADVMVHLVDLVQWECFPGQAIDYTKDIAMESARHWATPVSREQFKASTGLAEFPGYLSAAVDGDNLNVYSNGEINYRIKGVCAKTVVTWEFQAPVGGGDTHYSVMRGSLATLAIRQGKEQNFVPELYIEPSAEAGESYAAALQTAFAPLAEKYPGIALEPCEGGWHVVIPADYRNGHEAHFGQVTENFLKYLKEGKLPDWEIPGMIAKYYVVTKGWEMSQGN